MKCIKAIKEGKYSKIGEILRIEDKDAHQKVDSGYWEFIPKSEWKKSKVVETEEQKVEISKKEETKAKKAQKVIKLKEKQRK